MAISANGRVLASAQSGRVPLIRVWDPATAHTVAHLHAHDRDVSVVALSSDGSVLCGFGKDSRCRDSLVLWDVQNALLGAGAQVLVSKCSAYPVTVLKFVPGQHTELISAGPQSIRYWRVKDGKIRSRTVSLQHKNLPAIPTFNAICFSFTGTVALNQHDDPRVYLASGEGLIVELCHTTKSLLRIIQAHSGPVLSLDWCSSFFVSGGADRVLRMWTADLSQPCLEAEHSGSVGAVAISPDKSEVAVGTLTNAVGLVKMISHSYTSIMRGHSGLIRAFAMHPSRNEFATGAEDGTVRVWDLDVMLQVYEFHVPAPHVAISLAFHPREEVLACGLTDGSVRIFDLPSASQIEELKQGRGSIGSVLYSLTGACLFAGGSDGRIVTYDCAHCYVPLQTIAAANGPLALALSADGKWVAAAGLGSSSVVLYNANSLQLTRCLECVSARQLSFTVDGALLCLNMDGSLLAFTPDAAVYDCLPTDETSGHKDVAVFTTSANCRYLVTSCETLMKVHAFPPVPGSSQTFVGHVGGAVHMAFSPQSDQLVTVGSDAAIFVWTFHGDRSVDLHTLVDHHIHEHSKALLKAEERQLSPVSVPPPFSANNSSTIAGRQFPFPGFEDDDDDDILAAAHQDPLLAKSLRSARYMAQRLAALATPPRN
eukprot:gnl/Spiro4/17294_TR9210_c0_g1_i1.p2 gnl/Spiro4/17294_TR9210_c0_g1~~gnl/Spiro4/17294_TR9210_c0_g1_i1.p2  ORF type:complete len:654 (+),score=197.83 gnl/Spiro4/17294_TR9210_c0_g1_i1:1030-2991(+)